MAVQAITEKAINRVLGSYPKEKRFSLAILQDIQHSFGYVPRQALEAVSLYLDIKLAALYSMATFYRALKLQPVGKFVVKVCDGTACHIRGGPVLLDALERALRIKAGETTTDGIFSMETVNCLGACAIAPVMTVNEKFHSKVKAAEVEKILAGYRKPRPSPKGEVPLRNSPPSPKGEVPVRRKKHG